MTHHWQRIPRFWDQKYNCVTQDFQVTIRNPTYISTYICIFKLKHQVTNIRGYISPRTVFPFLIKWCWIACHLQVAHNVAMKHPGIRTTPTSHQHNLLGTIQTFKQDINSDHSRWLLTFLSLIHFPSDLSLVLDFLTFYLVWFVNVLDSSFTKDNKLNESVSLSVSKCMRDCMYLK